ncbi:MAG: hypothetical protein WD342_10820 [Verrucomicrobiales bacterium]
MSDPPRDGSEFWIRFVCAFVVFGLVATLVIFEFIETLGLAGGAGVWAVIVVALSVYAARVGDEAWRSLFDALRWW